jgi:UDPglucose--hexose-1-phosphate uridylyltransferase
VVLAPGRAERPDAFAPALAESKAGAAESCPFCEGREDRTPPEVWADRPGGGAADTPGWRVRSVPNLYPVVSHRSSVVGPSAETSLSSSVDPLAESRRTTAPDLFASQPAEGSHEVIVSTPRHVTSLAGLSPEELEVTVAAWRERMRALGAGSSYVHLIVNEGPLAGASLEHTHAQLYGLRFVPAEIARERERATAYHQRTMGSHLLGDVATEEVRRRDRLVAIDDDALLICPWASRSPFELRIVPRRPAPSFEAEGEGAVAMIGTALRALAAVFGALPQFNLWIRTAPRGAEEFCWHIDLLPRLTIRAGFELGTGVDINTYAPERAAADLREALP